MTSQTETNVLVTLCGTGFEKDMMLTLLWKEQRGVSALSEH